MAEETPGRGEVWAALLIALCVIVAVVADQRLDSRVHRALTGESSRPPHLPSPPDHGSETGDGARLVLLSTTPHPAVEGAAPAAPPMDAPTR